MKKYIKFSAFFILILAIFFVIPKAKSDIKPYYTGEAINFQNKIIFGTANMGVLEIFQLENGQIIKKNVIKSDDDKYANFSDLIFNIESNRLYIYATNGRYLYKYDATYLDSLKLIKKIKDNSWDWFYSLSKINNRIVTIGTQGVKLWNYNSDIINSYKIYSTQSENIGVSRNADFIYKIDENRFQVIDGLFRNVVTDARITIKDDHIRRMYNDEINGGIFVVDDSALKRIFFDGSYSEFRHISDYGYDVDGINGREYVYFSDGIGVVKIRKGDMAPVDWVYTSGLGSGNGWAMGLRVVPHIYGEVIIVFNGGNILALDNNLDLIDYHQAQEGEMIMVDPLSLRADKYWGRTGSYVYVYGKGFSFNEEVEVKFLNERYEALTNKDGSFSIRITVPNTKPGKYDIKTTGLISEKTYSFSYEIVR
ncbi:hypothetical protein KAI65_06415 [Candidatus Parcubacteria bacterium]|nr:hypothetical protein [Candidatus Parcubacteria bacterium]